MLRPRTVIVACSGTALFVTLVAFSGVTGPRLSELLLACGAIAALNLSRLPQRVD